MSEQAMTQTAAEPIRATPEQRTAALERYVATAGQQGWRVQSMTSTQAQLLKGKPTNHVLHLILSLITLGAWLLVWAAVVLFAGQKQRLVTVDEFGNVQAS